MTSDEKKSKSSSKSVGAIIILAIIIAAGIGAGLYFSAKPTPTPTPTMTTATSATPLEQVTISLPSVGSTGLPGRIIADQHLDQQYGLKINFLFLSVSAAIEDVITGASQVGIMPPMTAATEQLRGHDIVLFAPLLFQHNSILVRNDSSINSIQDLKGKRVGFDPLVTSATQYWITFLKAKGIDVQKDFKLTLADLGARIELFQRGDLDAIAIFEPNTSVLLSTGRYREIATTYGLSNELVGADTPFIALGCYRDWYNSHKATAEKIRALFNQVLDQIVKDPTGMLTKYAKVYGLDNPSSIQLAAKRIIQYHIYTTEWDQTALGALDKALNLAVQAGVLKQLPPKPIYVT